MFVEIFKAIILGIVEGLTEFLPVSSTGHLIIVGELMNFKGEFADLFIVVIQLGAILSVIVYYRKKIFGSLTKLMPGQAGFNLWSKVLVGIIPFGIIGFTLKDFIEETLFSTTTVAITLIVGAILIFVVDKMKKKSTFSNIEDLTYLQALLIGMAQCMAIFPGMSRSASTILGGMLIGMTLTGAAEFSFFLAIPTMVGATFLSLLDGMGNLSTDNWIFLGVGFAVSFLVALIVIDKFIGFLSKYSLKPFAYYRIALGIIMILFFL